MSLKRPIDYILTPVNRLIATFLRLLRLSTLRSLLVIPGVCQDYCCHYTDYRGGECSQGPGGDNDNVSDPRNRDQTHPVWAETMWPGGWTLVTGNTGTHRVTQPLSRSPCHANTESEWENIKHTLAGHQSPCASVSASHVSDEGKRYTYNIHY